MNRVTSSLPCLRTIVIGSRVCMWEVLPHFLSAVLDELRVAAASNGSYGESVDSSLSSFDHKSSRGINRQRNFHRVTFFPQEILPIDVSRWKFSPHALFNHRK